MPIAEFTEPQLVAIYDTVNAYGPGTQPDFYLALAEEVHARTVIDLGCGTGLITLQLASQGYRVIGADPSPLMLAEAQRKAGAATVEWIEGGADRLGTPGADLAIMSGHVAQFFLTDGAWHEALVHLRHALGVGGRLAFESRNPHKREWERWTAERRRTVDDPIQGAIECWTEVTEVRGDLVSAGVHRRSRRADTVLMSPVTLRFRTEEQLRESLERAGFVVEAVYGDWDRRAASPVEPELIFVAARSS